MNDFFIFIGVKKGFKWILGPNTEGRNLEIFIQKVDKIRSITSKSETYECLSVDLRFQ